MTDMFTKAKRSEIMARIRSSHTRPEMLFKRFLEESGTPFIYQPKLFGRPDFLINDKIVAFIDSAFWHGKGNMPKQNRRYWVEKLERNRRRDSLVDRRLRQLGYRVVRLDDRTVLRSFKDFASGLLRKS
jgi:DNA mismatch endonuclease (patch repair protein)